MIFPVPAGVHPSTHRCGCGGILLLPYRHELRGNALRCMTDGDHDTYAKKHTGTRMLFDGATGQLKEYDVMTQRATTELAPITDHATALAAVRKSIDVGQFSGRQTETQIQLIASLALAYRLDPMMEEIIPMYGKPYITIKGRRRLDNAAGNHFGLAWKIPEPDFLAYYQSMGAIDKGDVVSIAVGTYMGTDTIVEVWARCKVHEVAGTDVHLPINAWKMEMSQKRAERKLRETMFGPIPKPKGFEDVEVLEEGDEENIVEGTGRIVEDDPSLPDLGNCPAHDSPWKVEEFHGLIRGSHFVEGEPWCQLNTLYGARFQEAYAAQFGESKKSEVDTWLKDHFNGKTWSKMDAPQHIEAVTLVAKIADRNRQLDAEIDAQQAQDAPESTGEPT